jgi:hypothetical protein
MLGEIGPLHPIALQGKVPTDNHPTPYSFFKAQSDLDTQCLHQTVQNPN